MSLSQLRDDESLSRSNHPPDFVGGFSTGLNRRSSGSRGLALLVLLAMLALAGTVLLLWQRDARVIEIANQRTVMLDLIGEARSLATQRSEQVLIALASKDPGPVATLVAQRNEGGTALAAQQQVLARLREAQLESEEWLAFETVETALGRQLSLELALLRQQPQSVQSSVAQKAPDGVALAADSSYLDSRRQATERIDHLHRLLLQRTDAQLQQARSQVHFALVLTIVALLVLGSLIMLFLRKQGRERREQQAQIRENALAANRNAERRLRSLGEEQLLRALDNSPAAHMLIEGDRITYVNSTFVRMIGYEALDLGGLSDWHERGYPDPKYRRWVVDQENGLLQAAASGAPLDPIELRVRCFDGSVRVMREQVSMLERESGNVTLFTMVDLTAVSILNSRLQNLFETASDGIHVLDLNGDMIECSETFARMLGYTRDEARMLNMLDWELGGDAQQLRQRLISMAGMPMTFETVHRRKDGSTLPVEINAKGIELDGSHFIYASSRDISERKNTEERYRTLFEMSPDAVLIARERDGVIIDVNDAFAALLDWPRHDCVGKTTLELGMWPDPVQRKKMLDLMRRDGKCVNREVELLTRDDAPVVVLISGNRAVISGEPCLLWILRDMTGQRQAERALRSQHQLLELFIEHVPAAVAMLDSKMRYLSVSRRWLGNASGARQADDSAARPHFDLFSNDPARWREAFERAMQGEVLSAMEDRFERRDGTVFWFHWVMRPWRDARGEIGGVVVFAEDVTERHHSEERLRETQKLEAVGQLTGGLAHDFNNLLGIVMGNLDWLQENLPGDQKVQRRFHSALDAAERAAAVTKSLLSVARRRQMEILEVDINELIREMLPLVNTSVGADVSVQVRLTETPLRVRIDASGMSSVLLNLVINARDAMREVDGDHLLLIRTRREHFEEDATAQLASGWYVVLEVTDTGAGMNETIRAQAFEPFFTTKERGHGTGLGLAMVYGYAKQLRGSAVIHSREGLGTTLQVFLPCDAPSASEAALHDPQARVALVIADDHLNQALDCALLEAQGLVSCPVDSPDQLDRLPQSLSIGLLMLHLSLPGSEQEARLQMVQQALQRWPQMAVLTIDLAVDLLQIEQPCVSIRADAPLSGMLVADALERLGLQVSA